MSNGRTIQVLQKLLEKIPDSSKLEKLLDAENLLNLLLKYGWDKETVRQALKNGKIPGDLLLELLDKEPDVDRLLAQLGSTDMIINNEGSSASVIASLASAPVSEKPVAPIKPVDPGGTVKQPSVANAPTTAQVKRRGNLFGHYYTIVVLTIFALSAVMPALIISGFLPRLSLTPDVASVIAFVGGAVAGALSSADRIFSWKGMIVGIVYSLSTLWATIFYTQARTSIFRIEIAIPLILAGIPAGIVYLLLSRISRPAQ